MGSLIYLGIMIAFLFIVKAVLSRMEEMSEKRKKQAERREKVRNYETINYDNFNVEKGIYEN
jgi:hypothetical protein